MGSPLLQTKLYIPPVRPELVSRLRLIERLNESMTRKLTLISTSAGFGKTTLLSDWIRQSEMPVVWLSLDNDDNDPVRFLTYFIAALQQIDNTIGQAEQGMLASPQPPSPEILITSLINEISVVPNEFALVLDDYHVIETKPVDASTSVDDALIFLLEHLPPQMHLVIATREDPNLPLSRYRVRDQLTELRAADLRFTPAEAAGFLNQVMGLNLSAEDIAALETRTEGWIAGLQLAALALQGFARPEATSMQGHQDATSFIKSFTGSHHFVLDYLVEEVLRQQSESVQAFLLHTSILNRLCGPLCDAVLEKAEGERLKDEENSSSFMLEYLERANLFIIPLDNERRWYRYHHLFAGFLRQRLLQGAASSTEEEARGVAQLHSRASQWYEDNGLEVEAFHHAAVANDIERVERLIEGERMPLIFRGAAVPVLNWLESLPITILDARPSLWVTYASALLFVSQVTGVEEKLQSAEAALGDAKPDEKPRDLIGHIAAIRATLAVVQYDAETIITQSHRALEYLHPDNLPVRTATTWTLGVAHQLQGDRVAAGRAYTEAISISQAIGHFIITIMSTIGLGQVQETENQPHLAVETYRRVLQLVGDPPLPVVCEAHLGLARIFYEWNDLDAAQQHGQQSAQLARQIENTDRLVASEVFLARLKLAQGNTAAAMAILEKPDQIARQQNFIFVIPDVVATQVMALLRQDNLTAAAQLAEKHEFPLSQARVYLAQGDTDKALALLEPLRQQMEAKGWQDERLKVMVLQAVVLHVATLQADSEDDKAVQLLGDALALAEPGGFIRIFVDEGLPMAELLTRMKGEGGRMKEYVDKLLTAFEAEEQRSEDKSSLSTRPSAQPLIEPLSQRELEVLQLIVQGLSNREISERLFLALDTVKGHNRRIYGKLQVQRRTEAVARAHELDLL